MKFIIKVFSLLLAFCILCSGCSIFIPTETVPDEVETIIEPTPPTAPPTEPPTMPPAPPIEAQAGFVYDLKKHEFIYTNEAQTKIAPASITKLLTACLALKYFNTDAAITVGNEVNMTQPNSSMCFIYSGQKITMLDLLYGLLLQSGNDAAYTIAVNVARADKNDYSLSDSAAVEHFLTLMNTFGAEIGMKNSHFTSPDGYDTADQHVTAEDILCLALEAKKHPILNTIMSTYQRDATYLTGETISWTNTNMFLDPAGIYYNKYVLGMKTGSTNAAGTCLLTHFNDGDHDLIVFVAGCSTDESRYVQTMLLIAWALQ